MDACLNQTNISEKVQIHSICHIHFSLFYTVTQESKCFVHQISLSSVQTNILGGQKKGPMRTQFMNFVEQSEIYINDK